MSLGPSEVRKGYGNAPSIAIPDIIACVGAFNSGTPTTIVSRASSSTIVRGVAGGGSRWLTEPEAIVELVI
jgi:hypothetical protein